MVVHTCNPNIQEVDARGSEVQVILHMFEANLECMKPCFRKKETDGARVVLVDAETDTLQKVSTSDSTPGSPWPILSIASE